MNLQLRRFSISFITLFFGLTVHGYSQLSRDTLSVLFVGNSYTYTNNLPQLVSILSESTSTYLLTKQSTAPGAMLSQHWQGKKGLETKSIIKEGNYDVVILQDHSLAPLNNPDSFNIYIKKFADLIHSVNAKVFLYQTWARDSLPETQKEISLAYRSIAESLNEEQVPVGDAWALMKEKYPTVNLYSNDGSHPDRAGTFLTAYMFAYKLTGQKPQLINKEFSTLDKRGEYIQLMYLEEDYFKLVEDVIKEISNTK